MLVVYRVLWNLHRFLNSSHDIVEIVVVVAATVVVVVVVVTLDVVAERSSRNVQMY